ncbi:aminoacyl tRNA synthase complex-interacting multifunctional protein 1a [Rhincodon typus]|uniref:aminoacyl tRNA synthase complex-interacting multifunctional protein 1a n=1 Tax=Rhincodon typus TaxID=259920 RepID=UPI00202EB67F|nr:aminoacyl tRNA synthase complex-interacting multifunctional protein 1a [Rhincodon typus]
MRFLVRQLIRMSSDRALLNRLEQRAAEADQVIEYLKQQVALLKEKAILQASQREEKRLRVENAKLKKEIEDLKQNLIEAEIRNGVKRVPLPTAASVQSCSAASMSPTTALATPTAAEQTPEVNENKKKKDKPDKKPDKKVHTELHIRLENAMTRYQNGNIRKDELDVEADLLYERILLKSSTSYIQKLDITPVKLCTHAC